MIDNTPYPSKALFSELFFLAHGLHFGYEELMDMEHSERVRWVDMLSEHFKKERFETERLRQEIKSRRR